MQLLFIAFVVSLLATLAVVRSARLRALAADLPRAGPQKVHARAVPRIGGVGICAGALAALGLSWWQSRPDRASLALLLACAAPAVVAGVTEDLTQRVRVLVRLAATMLSAALAVWLLGAVVLRTDMVWVDGLLTWAPALEVGSGSGATLAVVPLAWLFTVVAVAGLANAVNIIDGLNGLASMVSLMMFASLGYVALQVGDTFILGVCLLMIGAIAGFFVFNFPAGLIFLGDGGAYLLGFLLAECAVLLVARNPTVSPWYPMLLFIYPIFETLFSAWRRVVVRGRAPGMPDGVHLHSLLYRRIMRWMLGPQAAAHVALRNSMTSPYLWVLCSLAVLPATVYWRSSGVLMGFVALFCISYVWLYARIVRFRTPVWMRPPR